MNTPISEKPTNPKDVVGIRKAPMSTVPAAVMAEVGVAMMEGALKYGRHNFRQAGVRASVYYDALMRHMFSWWEMGEDLDPDSQLSHITKAITGLMVLRDSMISGNWEDDRPPSMPEFYVNLNAKASALLDRYADRTPVHYTQAMRHQNHEGVLPLAEGWKPTPVVRRDLPDIEWKPGDPDRRKKTDTMFGRRKVPFPIGGDFPKEITPRVY